MKKITLIISFLAFIFMPVFSQVSTDPTDEFYDLVERWEIQGIIMEQPPLRPYPLQLVQNILSEVIEGDNEIEAEIAEEYYERAFKRPYKVNVLADGSVRFGTEDEDDNDKQLILGLGAAGDISFPKILTAGYDLNVYATNDPSLDALPQFSAQPYYFRDSVDLKKLEAFLIMDASFAGNYEDVYAQLGVSHLSFGPFYKKSAVLSPDAKHTANFEFMYAGDRISYTQALFGLSASNALESNNDLFSKKFLALHSINGTLFPWLSLSFYEVAIYGDRIEPAYLIPIPFIITQGLTGFDDNIFMGISFTVRPIPGLAWVNDFFIDDMGLEDLIRLNFDTKIRGTFQSAIKYSPVNINWLDMVNLSYTMVTPYMYTHKQNLINPEDGSWHTGTLGVINYQEYTTAGDPLGLSLPPNTEEVALSVTFAPLKRFKLTAHGSISRHSNVNEALPEYEVLSYLKSPKDYFTTDGGIHNHQHYLDEGDPEKSAYLDSAWNHFLFLTQPTKMYTYHAGLEAEYTFVTNKFGSLSLQLGYLFERIENYGVDNQIFVGMGGKYVNKVDDKGNPVLDEDGKPEQVWVSKATKRDIQKSLDSWHANLKDLMNHYITFGLKYSW